MRRMQDGLAPPPIALHMQHDYLPPIAAQRCAMSRTEKEHTMAAIETSRPAPFGAIATYRALNSLSNVLAALGAWNDARVTRKALSKLSDRELDDIGLCRGDIEMLGR